MNDELYDIYKRNFSYNIREEKEERNVLYNEFNHVIEKRIDNKLIGCSVINKSTILMLCVDKEYRNKGIGSSLLKESEEYIKSNGYNKVNVGSGFNYLMPGVPTSKHYYKLDNEDFELFNINEDSSNFFEKRGYIHSWVDADCFDMKFELKDVNKSNYKIGDTIDGILYRWGTLEDLDNIIKCSDDAEIGFSKYYKIKDYYDINSPQRVIIALDNDKVVGCLFVSREVEGKNIGSIGCTAVIHSHRGRHIAVKRTNIATTYLESLGLKIGHLGYTYTGLDHLYGYSGYKICVFYMMAEKEI